MESSDNTFLQDPSMVGRTVLTDRERYSRGLTSAFKGDKIQAKRIELPATFEGDLVNFGSGASFVKTTATIATGVILYASSYMEVDTEAAAAADNLDTITAGIAVAGTLLIIKSTANARVPTLTDGTGNLRLAGVFALDNTQDRITLLYDGTNWVELARSNNA
jgi:hypothetical protein